MFLLNKCFLYAEKREETSKYEALTRSTPEGRRISVSESCPIDIKAFCHGETGWWILNTINSMSFHHFALFTLHLLFIDLEAFSFLFKWPFLSCFLSNNDIRWLSHFFLLIPNQCYPFIWHSQTRLLFI